MSMYFQFGKKIYVIMACKANNKFNAQPIEKYRNTFLFLFGSFNFCVLNNKLVLIYNLKGLASIYEVWSLVLKSLFCNKSST